MNNGIDHNKSCLILFYEKILLFISAEITIENLKTLVEFLRDYLLIIIYTEI
ncbi:hypothetical protein EMIT036CA2_40247 [Chryseobacterium sp. IT-36CA2]